MSISRRIVRVSFSLVVEGACGKQYLLCFELPREPGRATGKIWSVVHFKLENEFEEHVPFVQANQQEQNVEKQMNEKVERTEDMYIVCPVYV